MKRKNILYLWILSFFVLISGSIIAWWFSLPDTVPYIKERDFSHPELTQQEKKEFSSKEIEFLKMIYDKLTKYLKRSVSVTNISSDLFLLDSDWEKKGLPKVSLVCVGRRSFAIIDGKVYKKGDRLADGSLITVITPKGVGIKKEEKIVFLPWIAPKKVFFLDLGSEKKNFEKKGNVGGRESKIFENVKKKLSVTGGSGFNK